jgi:hypothetical protein
MRNTIIYLNLVIASLLVIALFVTATTYLQLGVASALYPLLVYLIYKVLLPKLDSTYLKKPATENLQPLNSIKEKGILDTDKRGFLRLIGVAGLSFFLFSIFSKRGGVPFFGKLTGGDINSSADLANTAESLPTDGYRISEIDDSDITFYGFTNKDGGWFIMKEDIEGSFRYSKGDSDFSGYWARRESLKYDYYHNTF